MKIKDSAKAVLPIVLFIILFSFTPLYNLSPYQIGAFLVASVLTIVGIAIFDWGADVSMTPMGQFMGEGLTAKKKFTLLLIVSFLVGTLTTISEPDLEVLANQLGSLVDKTTFIMVVGVGVGVMLLITIIKIFFKKSLSLLLMFFHLVLFAVTIIAIEKNGFEFISLAYDCGGVTTGPITVPFVLALGIGISTTLNSRDSKDNSFGLIALCSVGAIIAVLFLSIFMAGDAKIDTGDYGISNTIYTDFLHNVPHICKQVGISLGLIVVLFLICQFAFLKLDFKTIKQLAVGLVFTFIGLVFLLVAVETVFIDVGFEIGSQMAKSGGKIAPVLFTFVLGALIVIAEPAIQVMVRQVEDITNGLITKKSMLIGLAVGVGLAVCLSVVRIIYNFNLMYIVVPVYVVSLGLSFFVPPIYTAIAFDSGGVATGPLTSSFILPLMVGFCTVLQGSSAVLQLAYGVLAMVGVFPLITVQLLGFGNILRKNREKKIAMRRILSSDDKQIISFE
ncbi:MAG: DUF1538 domain-containing protein [Clostridia bacterium]|nr:DUF1538 domain-containing protein [Clostridia bacterium]